MSNIWYVKFPTSRYKEDVKVLARKNNLKIIDVKFQGKEKQCNNPPKLTLVKEDDIKHSKKDDIKHSKEDEL